MSDQLLTDEALQQELHKPFLQEIKDYHTRYAHPAPSDEDTLKLYRLMIQHPLGVDDLFAIHTMNPTKIWLSRFIQFRRMGMVTEAASAKAWEYTRNLNNVDLKWNEE